MYELRLSDHQCWGVESAADTREWTDNLACLLGLEPMPGPADRTIHLERLPAEASCDRENSRVPRYGYPGEQWKVRILPYLEFWRHPAVPDVIFRLRQTTQARLLKEQMRHFLFPLYESTVYRGGLPLHAAFVEHDGRGVLLVGRSGVGKSTACRRLPCGWSVLCDDMALAVKTTETDYRVHPLPTWSVVKAGKTKQTWNIRQNICLTAIFFLTQAAADEVIPAGGAMASVILADAAMTIFRSVMPTGQRELSPQLRRIVFNNAASLASSVPAYILHLSLTGRFWEKIEEALEKRDIAVLPGSQKLLRTPDLPLQISGKSRTGKNARIISQS